RYARASPHASSTPPRRILGPKQLARHLPCGKPLLPRSRRRRRRGGELSQQPLLPPRERLLIFSGPAPRPRQPALERPPLLLIQLAQLEPHRGIIHLCRERLVIREGPCLVPPCLRDLPPCPDRLCPSPSRHRLLGERRRPIQRPCPPQHRRRTGQIR